MTETVPQDTIDPVRLLLAAIKSNGEIIVKSDNYMSGSENDQKICMEVNEDGSLFRLTLVEGELNESRPDGE